MADQPRSLIERFTAETSARALRGAASSPRRGRHARGVDRIVRHGDHTHLAHSLELPERPSDVQEELGIEDEASYALSIKNPEEPAPPQAGLP